MVLSIKNPKILAKQSVNLFITGLLILPCYIDLMASLSQMVGFNTKLTTYAYYGLLWVALLASIPKILRAISTLRVLLGSMLFFLFVIVIYLLFPDNRGYTAGVSFTDMILFSPKSLLAVVPYILIGLAITDTEKLFQHLHTGARLGVVMGALSYTVAITQGYELHYDDMNSAYALCVMVCILIAGYQKHDVYFLILGGLSLLLAGTRGPLLCVAVTVLIRILLMEDNAVRKISKVSITIIVIILLQSGLLVKLAELIADAFATIGITQLRIIDYIRSEMLTDSSGRNAISNLIVKKIMERPLGGFGPGGDRIAMMSNSYAHNIALEIWISYGIFIGTLILGWMGYWFARGILGKDRPLRAVVVALFCGVMLKLFLSSSYLYAKELFIALGICMAGCKILPRKTTVLPEENENV